jgi:small GTP-binding protein
VRETADFKFDLFLSHSAKDKAVVRAIAERLQQDGLTVWFDEWALKPGDSITAKVEDGLERSRVLVLCMSANAFGSEWTKLEAGTFRFRDPLNEQRRFIPLRLDDSPTKGPLSQFPYIDWRSGEREEEYAKLLEGCRPRARSPVAEKEVARHHTAARAVKLRKKADYFHYELSPNRKYVLSCSTEESLVRLWDVETGRSLRVLEGHTDRVIRLAWSPDGSRALSGGEDGTMRLWDVETGNCVCVFVGHASALWAIACSVDGRRALSGDQDGTIRLWDVEAGRCLRVLSGHTSRVFGLAWSPDNSRALSGGDDRTIRLWDVETGRCIRVLEGHTECVTSVAWSTDGRYALSAGGTGFAGYEPATLRLWDVRRGRCLRVLRGHTKWIAYLAVSDDGRHALSGGGDKTVRLWDLETGECLRVLAGHDNYVRGVAWSIDGRHAFSGDENGHILQWDLSEFITKGRAPKVSVPSARLAPDQMQYTNAKVLLVGESGVGKTGLSMRLASGVWKPSDSTVGAWATRWRLPASSRQGVEQEIWLWDFGGQADQRLIHQLYMDETSMAVLVFDGQKEDLFETLSQWDRDLTRASRKDFAKLLVAGRADAGGLSVSRGEVENFAAEHEYLGFFETSAKKNLGCEELKQAILAGIKWDEIPCRTTEVLFKRLKEEIIRLKAQGRVLMRFNELRETLQLRLSGQFKRFADEELHAVLTLLAGPGVVWKLKFGNLVLLQPEYINAYAQAVIRTLGEDDRERGCVMEERVLKGNLVYQSSMARLSGDEERFVLLAMHQALVERGLCLRQPTPKGNLLIFPSYYRRERPEQVKFPAVLVNYRFTGFLDEIYATLVVRLHHSDAFEQDQLWRYAADFKTMSGKRLGIRLRRIAPSAGDLDVYFDGSISESEKIIFSKYVHEHLLQHARDVERIRGYACPHCGTPVGNRDEAMRRLNSWLEERPSQPGAPKAPKRRKHQFPSIICVNCETKRVPLWDKFEQSFASAEIQQRVRDMQDEANIELDNESKERALVGEVISTVALAAQISREHNVSDHGIDMEIEFKDDAQKATGAKLYLQLKSGDSYTRTRKHDGTEVFRITDERHASYWMAQAFPVLLVIRNSEGEVRWMEVRDWLKRETNNGQKLVKNIVFDGERFDVMSVRRWREKILSRQFS